MNQTNTSCFRFSEKEVTGAFAAKATVGSLSFMSCGLVILLILLFRGYRRFVYRLVVYFISADLLQSFTQVFKVASVSYDPQLGIVSVREGWGTACVVFGFMDQVSMWISNFVIIWIMLYLLSLAYRLRHVQGSKPMHTISQTFTTQAACFLCRSTCKEVIGVIVVVTLPLTFNWVPFLWNMYGLSGLFCWMKEVSNGNCNDRTLSIILMFSMSYGPLLSLIFAGFLCLLTITLILCRGSTLNHKDVQSESAMQKRFKEGLKEMSFVLVFPLLYNLLCLIIVANRLYSVTHSEAKPLYPLWIAHLIASPGRLLVSPVAFMLHPYTWKTLICHKRESGDIDTHFIVPPEDEDIEEPIIIKGTEYDKHYGTCTSGLVPQ